MSGPMYFRTRYFTNIVGASSKFWSIRVNPNASYTVMFGRIGTVGQARTWWTKLFTSQWKAQQAAGRIIQQKLDKGYVETGEVLAESVPIEAPPKPLMVLPPGYPAKRKKRQPEWRKKVKKAVKAEPVGRVISFEKEE